MAQSDVNPHIGRGFSPLQALIAQALRRYGEFGLGSVDGDTSLMFVEFANMVLDDIRGHVYHDRSDLPYYTALTDTRPVADPIIIAGLLYHYSMQQTSEKVQFYMPNYFRTMNQLLWQGISGSGAIQLRVVDDGTNPRNAEGRTTSLIHGRTSEPE